MRILLVEDEPQIADFIARGLYENGYSVDVARDGEEALEWPSVANFDVIILDIMLPEVDGIEVCRTLRTQGLRTPILMLTARDAVGTACAAWTAAPMTTSSSLLLSPNCSPVFVPSAAGSLR